MDAVFSSPLATAGKTPWLLRWLTPGWCRAVLAGVLLVGFLLHLRYLLNNCPIDLSADEAQYWDWSRQLDWSYYSKGPLVAWIIRGSCAIFGDNMPAVRLPALLLAVGTSLATYWLAAKLFKSERLALGAVLLNHLVPMFVAGSVMMTIDPPLFFCWALATCFAAKAVFDDRPWAWIGVGIAVGLGFLAKYAMFLWLPGLVLFLWIDRDSRKHFRSPWLWAGLAMALLFTLPILIWNAQHEWVSLKHVAKQTGVSEGGFEWGRNLIELIGGQLIALGPALAVIMGGGVIYAAGRATSRLLTRCFRAVWWNREHSSLGRAAFAVARLARNGRGDPYARSMRFLLWLGLPFLAIVTLDSLRTKVQVNWPAPAYFTLMILTAYFLAMRLRVAKSWRRWQGWFWGTVVSGIAFTPIAHDTEILYQPIRSIAQALGRRKPIPPAQWDPTYKLRGWNELGGIISRYQETLSPGSMVLCEKYEFASEMAFYVNGQPKTFYVGSWFADPKHHDRYTQYDMWPDRRLDRPELIGKDAIFFGYPQEDGGTTAPIELVRAFDSVERLPLVTIRRQGMSLRDFRLWRCRGFKGMIRPSGEGRF